MCSSQAPLNLAAVRAAFAAQDPPSIAVPTTQRSAAVAIVFRADTSELRLCFGRRMPWKGDPWSGQMAFPGGKAEPADRDLRDVARREAWEETGLHLEQAEWLGALEGVLTHKAPNRPQLLIRPMVYVYQHHPGPFDVGPEWENAWWIPVSHLWDRRNWTTLTWKGYGEYPGIQFGEHIIWGLTLRMLNAFSEFVSTPLNIFTA